MGHYKRGRFSAARWHAMDWAAKELFFIARDQKNLVAYVIDAVRVDMGVRLMDREFCN